MFINHTLWDREDDRILFFTRAGAMWGSGKGPDVNASFTMPPDGSHLCFHPHLGGHPEWVPERRIMAVREKQVVLYDTDTKQYGDIIGDPAVFHDPGGDKALSPDGEWLVHGNRVAEKRRQHEYIFYRMADGFHAVSGRFDRGEYLEGPFRLDAAPAWDRTGTQVVVPALDSEGTRQMFLLTRREE